MRITAIKANALIHRLRRHFASIDEIDDARLAYSLTLHLQTALNACTETLEAKQQALYNKPKARPATFTQQQQDALSAIRDDLCRLIRSGQFTPAHLDDYAQQCTAYAQTPLTQKQRDHLSTLRDNLCRLIRSGQFTARHLDFYAEQSAAYAAKKH